MSLNERGLTSRRFPFLLVESTGGRGDKGMKLLFVGIEEQIRFPEMAAAAASVVHGEVVMSAGRCRLLDGKPDGPTIEFLSPRDLHEANETVGLASKQQLAGVVGYEIKPIGVQTTEEYPWWKMADLPLMRLES